MKRAISFIFIFLIISSGFSLVALNVSAAGVEQEHILKLYDGKGRLLDTQNDTILAENLKTEVFEQRYVLGVPVGWKKIAEGSNLFTFKSIGEIRIVSHWFNSEILDAAVIPKDYTVKVQTNSVPAIPIMNYVVEPVRVSSDLHEINTKNIDVKFGQGDKGNDIVITVGSSDVYKVPVNLNIGDNSYPFKFLAQYPGPNGVVKGEVKTFIWPTAIYFSSVKTVKVGPNSIMMVWTYGYSEIWQDWIKKIVIAATAGALIGSYGGGVGAAVGAAAGGIAASIAWAIKPELANVKKNMAIGVIAVLATPRYILIQGVSGLGANGTTGTIDMTVPGTNTHKITNSRGITYSIVTSSNTIQIGAVKYASTDNAVYDHFWDFEDGQVPSGANANISIYHNTKGAASGLISSGENSLHMINDAIWQITDVRTGWTISITGWSNLVNSVPVYVKVKKSDGTVVTLGKISQQKDFSFSSSITADGKLFLEHDSTNPAYIDDVHIIIYNTQLWRQILTDTATAPFVRLSFGTIPTIAPTLGNGVEIQSRNSLIMVDMPEKTTLGVDWASPQPIVIPSQIVIKSDTWSMDGLLLATDSAVGFKNVTFVLSYPGTYIYTTTYQTYTLFSSPENWTVTPDWTPFIANNTTVYVPNWDSIYNPWAQWQYNLNGWWQKIGTWGHLALMGLAGLIIFIIILIVAPWLIFALIEILGLVIRVTVKGLGVAAKGFGELMSKRRRKG